MFSITIQFGMNIVTDIKQSSKPDPNKNILLYYRMSDLDSVVQEISIDTFEEYANYRMKCK